MVQCFLQTNAFLRVGFEELVDEVFGLRADGVPDAAFDFVLSSSCSQQGVLHAVVGKC